MFFGLIEKTRWPLWPIRQKDGTLYSGARYLALWASCLQWIDLPIHIQYRNCPWWSRLVTFDFCVWWKVKYCNNRIYYSHIWDRNAVLGNSIPNRLSGTVDYWHCLVTLLFMMTQCIPPRASGKARKKLFTQKILNNAFEKYPAFIDMFQLSTFTLSFCQNAQIAKQFWLGLPMSVSLSTYLFPLCYYTNKYLQYNITIAIVNPYWIVWPQKA